MTEKEDDNEQQRYGINSSSRISKYGGGHYTHQKCPCCKTKIQVHIFARNVSYLKVDTPALAGILQKRGLGPITEDGRSRRDIIVQKVAKCPECNKTSALYEWVPTL